MKQIETLILMLSDASLPVLGLLTAFATVLTVAFAIYVVHRAISRKE